MRIINLSVRTSTLTLALLSLQTLLFAPVQSLDEHHLSILLPQQHTHQTHTLLPRTPPKNPPLYRSLCRYLPRRALNGASFMYVLVELDLDSPEVCVAELIDGLAAAYVERGEMLLLEGSFVVWDRRRQLCRIVVAAESVEFVLRALACVVEHERLPTECVCGLFLCFCLRLGVLGVRVVGVECSVWLLLDILSFIWSFYLYAATAYFSLTFRASLPVHIKVIRCASIKSETNRTRTNTHPL